ncbi:MAG: zinc-dependent peptidase [Burkholderiales bacterium]|nr:zinc-dependent peptidase [Burkholderiales bacterium]
MLGPLAFLSSLALAVAAWLVGPGLAARWRRQRVLRRPFPAAWREILRRRMPLYARLPPDLQQRLKQRAQLLIAEKPFIGCAGLVVSDEMRVLIAAQAALLLLHPQAGRFADLRQVLVYPGPFVVERASQDASGLTHETRRALAGESWQQGQVLLSWDDVLAGAADPGDGHNVVIHEFAHQLDQERGRANGAPWLGGRDHYARWAAVLGAEYAALRARLARDETGAIDAYAATSPAEFFAVVSEHFFEQPQLLAQHHGALFAELARYYGVDPRDW